MTVRHDEQRAPEAPGRPELHLEPAAESEASVATRIAPLLAQVFSGPPPVRFVFWDGSALGPSIPSGQIVLRSPRALTRLIWSPDELGMARGYVGEDIDFDGDLFDLLPRMAQRSVGNRRLGPRAIASGIRSASRVGAIRRPPPRPAEEVRLGGWRHSKARDSAAVSHHYDVSNDFYRLVLGPAMTYSCARFSGPETSLEQAQAAKHDLVCRKLGLPERPGARLLDIGCGWGSMALQAARQYGASVVGVTLSAPQAELARERVAEAGLDDKVEIRLQDYRDLRGETFDAISSIGMFEHVGRSRMDEYFATVRGLLAPTGRLLNHAISSPGGSKMRGRTFMHRYVFPDGELIDVADVVAAMERAGFEARDVESLREHYAQTLRAWVHNLESSWDEAVRLVGTPRARVWRLYMAASAIGFDDGGISIHQVLGVVPRPGGESCMPKTRDVWITPSGRED